MTENIRNIAIAVAVLVISLSYGATAMRTNNYYNRLDNARSSCLREGDNATNFNGFGYTVCMRYKGFDITLTR